FLSYARRAAGAIDLPDLSVPQAIERLTGSIPERGRVVGSKTAMLPFRPKDWFAPAGGNDKAIPLGPGPRSSESEPGAVGGPAHGNAIGHRLPGGENATVPVGQVDDDEIEEGLLRRCALEAAPGSERHVLAVGGEPEANRLHPARQPAHFSR